MTCKICGSYAINEHLHGREKGKYLDLCDVCYWRKMFYGTIKDPCEKCDGKDSDCKGCLYNMREYLELDI